LKTAQELGLVVILVVILRTGPFIDAERDVVLMNIFSNYI
jgi:hypothetical protein